MIFVFLASLAFTIYVLAGYPAILGLLAKYRSKPVRKAEIRPQVSIIIAVHNGEIFLRRKLESVLGSDYPVNLREVIVVSDGSTDATDEIAREFAPEGVRLLQVDRGGKPAALNIAIAQARGEILVLTDVRQTLSPDSIRLLVECFADETVGVASGELIIRKGRNSGESDVGLYWRYESWIRTRLAAVDSIFGATGPFYSIRRSLAGAIPRDILLDDMYLPLQAFFQGYRLIVEPQARAIDYPTTVGMEFKRKVRTLAGNWQLIGQMPRLLSFRNRMWFHFVSYKFARLFMPGALAALLVSGIFLPAPWALPVTLAQSGFYVLAVLDRLIPEGAAVKRLSSPAHTFSALMLATVFSLQIFFVEPRSLWKETRIVAPGGD